MARTIVKVYASAEERAAAAERSKRRCAGMLKAARIKTPEEIAALPPVKGAERARVRARVFEDSETEPDDESFASPQPLQVIKLSAQARVGGSRFWWRGRLRGGGADVLLEGAWVRQNFKRCGPPDRTRRSLPALTADARLARSQVVPGVGAGGGRALRARAHGQRAAGRPSGWA